MKSSVNLSHDHLFSSITFRYKYTLTTPKRKVYLLCDLKHLKVKRTLLQIEAFVMLNQKNI